MQKWELHNVDLLLVGSKIMEFEMNGACIKHCEMRDHYHLASDRLQIHCGLFETRY
jgi:hypothetical protein